MGPAPLFLERPITNGDAEPLRNRAVPHRLTTPFNWGWKGPAKNPGPNAEQYTSEPDGSERLDIARIFLRCSSAKATLTERL